jgi:hypothetical protein
VSQLGPWLAGLAHGLMRRASRSLPPADREWADAALAECEAVPGWQEQLRWAASGVACAARWRVLNVPRARSVAAMSAGAGAWVALMATILFVRFPGLTSTGDSLIQRSAGPAGARVAYVALCAAIAVAYVLVTLVGTRDSGPGHAHAWQLGTRLGVRTGVLALATYAVVGLTAHGVRSQTLVEAALLGALLIGPPLAGFSAGRSSGSVATGRLAGFWTGASLAMTIAVGMSLLDLSLSGRFVHTLWAGDHVPACASPTPAALQICEVGDDAGAIATYLLAGPIVASLLASPGALLGRLSATRRPRHRRRQSAGVRALARPGRHSRMAPWVFSAALTALFAVAITTHLW